jgi:hypothetical protein
MKRLLILTVLGMLLSGMTGCRFMECLFRGAPCQQQTAAPVVACPPACPTTCVPDSCSGATISPGPETTYAPSR